jgi:WD40 repeat protein
VDDCEICKDIHAHKLGIVAVSSAASQAESFFVTNSLDEYVKVWDFGGQIIRAIKSGPLQSWALSVSNEQIVTGGHGGHLNVYSLADGGLVKSNVGLQSGKFILKLVHSPNGQLLAASNESGTVYVLDTSTYNILHTFQGTLNLICRNLKVIVLGTY